MISIPRSLIMAAGLAVVSPFAAVAQQNNPANGNSAMQSTRPGGEGGAGKPAEAGAAMKSTGNGYEKKKVISGSQTGSETDHGSTGAAGKQSQ